MVNIINKCSHDWLDEDEGAVGPCYNVRINNFYVMVLVSLQSFYRKPDFLVETFLVETMGYVRTDR